MSTKYSSPFVRRSSSATERNLRTSSELLRHAPSRSYPSLRSGTFLAQTFVERSFLLSPRLPEGGVKKAQRPQAAAGQGKRGKGVINVFGMDISNEGPVFNYMLVNKLAKSFFGGPSPQWNVFPVLRKWVCFGKVAGGGGGHQKTSMEMEVIYY
jgi:hypothetical protein